MDRNFIHINDGKNTHLRYISSLFVILAFIFIIATIIYSSVIIVLSLFKPGLVNTDDFLILDPLLDFYLYHIVNFIALLGMWLVARTILKRKLISFITPNARINWSKIMFGFFISFLLFALFAILDFAIFPNDYALNDFDGTRFALLVVAAIVLVPIQTTSEELLFRGFLLQWAGKFTKNPIILMMIVGGIFGGLHFGNPEMEHGAFWVAIDYLAMGFIWTYITIKTNSSEYAIGAHAANNMFLCIFLTMDDTVVGDIPSLFLVTNVNEMLSAFTTITTGLIFLFVVLRKQRNDYQFK
ncbi:CPBP family intramembrane glutamic endopeptidase [Metabacillus sediminilitoris]|uniref:CPBP family intramembrane metalloprotease n=1 Tax=Metabacillus sediminilitoris TaxID=2567941 RepID=A0A4S4C7D6_9BACI|nr:type II CAAX endopeptidase family protein [Metabacillus sediminilitoris]QGQ47028.1 CPBP family intramembrane metalloprotease [Metabacillus sediminilitoris]THF83175.1 CPBP family intramembrane metalloprotease [Metabacillus sediminilitoris]